MRSPAGDPREGNICHARGEGRPDLNDGPFRHGGPLAFVNGVAISELQGEGRFIITTSIMIVAQVLGPIDGISAVVLTL